MASVKIEGKDSTLSSSGKALSRQRSASVLTPKSQPALTSSKSFRDSPSNGSSTLFSGTSSESPESPAASSKTPGFAPRKDGLLTAKGPFVSKTVGMKTASETAEKAEKAEKLRKLQQSFSSKDLLGAVGEYKDNRSSLSLDTMSNLDGSIAGISDLSSPSERRSVRDLTQAFTLSSASKIKVVDAALAPMYMRYSSAMEAVAAFHENLRAQAVIKPKPLPAPVASSPTAKSNTPSPGINRLSSKFQRNSSKSGKAAYQDDAESFLSTLRNQRSGTGEGGKVSSTIEEQWQFLRSHFKMSDEDLEWLMVAKHKGAYKYANKKHDDAEDRYFKGLYESEGYELQYKQMMSAEGIGEIPGIISQLSELHISNLVVDPVALNKFNDIKVKLRTALEKLEKSRGADYVTTLFSQRTIEMFKQILTDGILPSKAVRRAKELNNSVKEEFNRLQRLIREARKLCDDSLDEMEKWSRRVKEADEFLSAVREEEEEWLEKEYEDNQAALSIMRSYIPTNISELNVAELIIASKSKGGWYSLELASELKNNRLLHWVVTHKDDIAMANFLAGEKKSYFENIESLDIIELRAIVVCLPERFELDNDGRKNEWRARILGRAKQMVAQQRGEKVKGSWDGEKQCRVQTKLAPLKPDQERRPIYFYRSKEQCLARVKQYDDKEATLKKKTAWLATAKTEAEEAKREYDIILNEMRDPAIKASYEPAQIAQAKKMAKEQWSDAESKRKQLDRDVTQLKATIASNPITKEEFVASMKEMEDYLISKGVDWNTPGQPPILIEGVFEKLPEVNRTVRTATKFVSAEEEAEIRKQEILALKASKEAAAANKESEQATEQPTDTDLQISDIPDGDADEEAATDAEAATTPTPGSIKRRPSVLESNPEMAKTLNRMMGPGDGNQAASSPIRRSSVKLPGPVDGKSGEPVKEEVKEVKVTKSKLLLKLSGASEPEPETKSARPAAPSFLDQLKNRGKPGGAGGEGGAPSFLDQLKLKKKTQE